MKFQTHTGEIIKGKRLTQALNTVANNWIRLAHAIRKEDAYASHVSEQTKENELNKMLEQAERIRKGEEKIGFWLWQLLNTELTKECVAFLPK